MLLTKNKSNTTEVMISNTFIDSYISHDEFVLVNNILKEFDDKIRNLSTSTVYEKY